MALPRLCDAEVWGRKQGQRGSDAAGWNEPRMGVQGIIIFMHRYTATIGNPGTRRVTPGTVAASETQTYQPCQQYPAKCGHNTHNTKSATDPTHVITRGTAATGTPSINHPILGLSSRTRVSDKGCGTNLLSILSQFDPIDPI